MPPSSSGQDRKHSTFIRMLRQRWIPGAASPNCNLSRVVLLVWAGLLLLIIMGELLPQNSRPMMLLSSMDIGDKLLHFGAYAVLAFIPAIGLPLSSAIACLIASEVVGIGLEFAQLLVPDRSCDPYDAVANTIGVLAGTALAIVIRSRVVRAER
jgi:glycopeptide antibiotics resistance protein